MTKTVILTPGDVRLADWAAISRGASVELAASAVPVIEASSAPAQGDEQRIMANRSQTKDRVRAEIATLCDDPEWIERAIACFKD